MAKRAKRTSKARAATETPAEREAREIREAYESRPPEIEAAAAAFRAEVERNAEATYGPDWKFVRRWLNSEEFTLGDAAQLLRVQKQALWAAINRGTVPYHGERMGPGAEMKVRGRDIILFRCAQLLAALGVPRRVSLVSQDLVEGRVEAVLQGRTDEETNLLLWPIEGDWEFAPFTDSKPLDPDSVPFAAVVLRIDAMIREQLNQIRALAARKEQIETLSDAGSIPSKF